jgi:uncharacterized protein YuzE
MAQTDLTQLLYDAETDVLYLSRGEPRPSISRELGDDVLLRVDVNTGEIVGLTILNLAAHFGSLSTPQSLPIKIDLHAQP